MGVLSQLKPTALDVAKGLALTPKPAEAIRVKRSFECPQCQDTSFWKPIGAGLPICFVCSPPPTLAMVAKQFFFDDWKNIWRVDRNQDGSQSFIRETFEKGSPDVES
jgi:hypothetical protein